MIFLQYFIGTYTPAVDQYNNQHGVKLPTICWDMGGTGQNLQLGQALIQKTGNVWTGSSHFIIKPDKEYLHAGYMFDLRPKLEELGVPKDGTSLLNSFLIVKDVSPVTITSRKMNITVTNAGYYSFSLYNLAGKMIQLVPPAFFTEGNYPLKINGNHANSQFICRITTPNGICTQKVPLWSE